MNEAVKNALKKAGVYYSLQGRYRQVLFYAAVLLNRISYAAYRGSGFTCNFCRRQYTRFVPRYAVEADRRTLEKYGVISGDGENVYCPYCGSTCRERFLMQVLTERVEYKNKKILQLSPEKKIFDFLKKYADVVTADIETGFYQLIDKNVVYADAVKLPFENERFDVVMGNHIMEHIPQDILAMKEIFRVLKPGGRAIVQVPFSESIPATAEQPLIADTKKQSALFGQKDHVRIYSLEDYLNRLTRAGFTVNYIKPEQLNAWRQYAVQYREGFIDCVKC